MEITTDNFNKGHRKGSRFPFSENLFSKLWQFVLRLAKGRCKKLDKNYKYKFQPLSLVRQNVNDLSSFILNTSIPKG